MGRFDDYEPVEDRIRRFWDKYPTGRLVSDLIYRDDRQYIFRSEAFTDREDARPASVGYAEEIIGSSPVNKTNALENAETSAIGRCLANLGFAPKGARPSREEMEKASRGAPPAQRNGVDPDPVTMARARLAKACKDHGWSMPVIGKRWVAEHKVSLGEATDAEAVDRFRESLSGVPQAELVAAS